MCLCESNNEDRVGMNVEVCKPDSFCKIDREREYNGLEQFF